jgi:hypothetical protein
MALFCRFRAWMVRRGARGGSWNAKARRTPRDAKGVGDTLTVVGSFCSFRLGGRSWCAGAEEGAEARRH